MDHQDDPRKAAGSTDDTRHQCRTALRHQQQQEPYERPLDSPYFADTEVPDANTRRPSYSLPQAPPLRRASQSTAPLHRMSTQAPPNISRRPSATSQNDIYANSAQDDQDGQDRIPPTSSADDLSEWDLLDNPGSTSAPSPTATFPGTWPAALHDTSTALTQISAATTSYASALTSSGIGHASWSIGSAIASSANAGVFKLVSWAADRTGTGVDQLPRGVSGWVKRGRERRMRGRKGVEVEEGVVLSTAELDHEGEWVSGLKMVGRGNGEGDGWDVADTMGVDEGERGVMRRAGGDIKIEGDEEEDDDGMMRLFEFDD